MTLLAVFAFSSCSEEQGTEAGNDSTPVATLYTYAAETPYDADADCRLRIATNSATQEVYYLAELTSAYETRLGSGGESGIIEYVIANGTKAETSAETPIDVVLQNLGGENTIAVVAVGGSKQTLSTATFTGSVWNNVATGTYYFGTTLFGENASVETILQQSGDDPTQYRFKNLFGTGNHLTISTTEYTNSEGGTCVRVSAQATPYSYGSYGTIYCRDVATWQGVDGYLEYNALFENGYCYIWMEWYVSAGYLDYQIDEFVPAE